MEKFERNGEVAVLVSPGFGAGWYTWAYGAVNPFDPDMVQAVLDNDRQKALRIAEEKYPEEYHGGVEDLIVCWVPKGSRFEITEYDGSESLRIFGPDDGLVA